MERSQWKYFNQLFGRKASFLIAPHCQFRGVGQGMNQIYLYLWYPLFQAQWDRLKSGQCNCKMKNDNNDSEFGTWGRQNGPTPENSQLFFKFDFHVFFLECSHEINSCTFLTTRHSDVLFTEQ